MLTVKQLEQAETFEVLQKPGFVLEAGVGGGGVGGGVHACVLQVCVSDDSTLSAKAQSIPPYSAATLIIKRRRLSPPPHATEQVFLESSQAVHAPTQSIGQPGMSQFCVCVVGHRVPPPVGAVNTW